MNLDDDVDLDELAKLCDEFTGADVKSIVCDALLKAFHRVHQTISESESFSSPHKEDDLRNSIKISREDFVASIETINKTINHKERLKLKTMY